MQLQTLKLTSALEDLFHDVKKQSERLRELERKTQILDEKMREQKKNTQILQETIREHDNKIQILQKNVTELTHEWKHVKNKFHLGSQRQFLYKYLQAVRYYSFHYID